MGSSQLSAPFFATIRTSGPLPAPFRPFSPQSGPPPQGGGGQFRSVGQSTLKCQVACTFHNNICKQSTVIQLASMLKLLVTASISFSFEFIVCPMLRGRLLNTKQYFEIRQWARNHSKLLAGCVEFVNNASMLSSVFNSAISWSHASCLGLACRLVLVLLFLSHAGFPVMS